MADYEPNYGDNYESASPSKKQKQPPDTLVNLLGASLQRKDGSKVSTSTALMGKKAVGLYFSAHWCPPCRKFTPMLGDSYKKYLKQKGLEVVFVSSDRDEASFSSYFSEQADWLALPFSARDVKEALSKKFKVSGIPTLVILDGETGDTITTDARGELMGDLKGARFPWRPPTFWEALGDEFLQGVEGETVDLEEVRAGAKVIGLYFSAHWCPPCRGFTPELVKAYTDHLKAKGLELIFVSSDRDAGSFAEYYGSMPWLAIPQGDARKDGLSKLFNVEGIPCLVLVDAQTGEEITRKGRAAVGADPTGAEFPWHPKPLVDAEAEGPDGINETTSLVALLDDCDAAARASALAALGPFAAEQTAAAKAAGEEAMLFFYSASKSGGFAPQVRQLCKAKSAPGKPLLLLLDIPDDGGYYVSDAAEISPAELKGFVERFKGGKLQRKQLG